MMSWVKSHIDFDAWIRFACAATIGYLAFYGFH